MPPTELLHNHGDIRESSEVLGFNPEVHPSTNDATFPYLLQVSIRAGVREFVAWFRWYQQHTFPENSRRLFELIEAEHATAVAARLNSTLMTRLATAKQQHDQLITAWAGASRPCMH